MTPILKNYALSSESFQISFMPTVQRMNLFNKESSFQSFDTVSFNKYHVRRFIGPSVCLLASQSFSECESELRHEFEYKLKE
jgi:hypothetical protein